jgi:hypothetical protein
MAFPAPCFKNEWARGPPSDFTHHPCWMCAYAYKTRRKKLNSERNVLRTPCIQSSAQGLRFNRMKMPPGLFNKPGGMMFCYPEIERIG